MDMRSPHNVLCPYTNLPLRIKRVEHMNMTGWKYNSVQAREYYVVKACVANHEELFTKFDDIRAGGSNKDTTPETYMWFLCARALEINPHLREAVGERAYKDVVGAKVERIPQQEETPTMMTPEDMKRLGVQRAMTAPSPEDQWHITAEICERQDRTNELLDALLTAVAALRPAVHQP